MLVIALLIVVILILARALKIIEGRCACARKVRKKIEYKIYYNLFIRYVMQSTLKVRIAAITTINLTDWATQIGLT